MVIELNLQHVSNFFIKYCDTKVERREKENLKFSKDTLWHMIILAENKLLKNLKSSKKILLLILKQYN